MARPRFDAPPADSFYAPRQMQRLSTRLPGLVLLAPAVHGDARGFFIETFRADAWAAEGVPTEVVQDNPSRPRRGSPGGAARGRVYVVVVALRRGSPTFGEWEAVELDDERGLQLYIPIGFAHGF